MQKRINRTAGVEELVIEFRECLFGLLDVDGRAPNLSAHSHATLIALEKGKHENKEKQQRQRKGTVSARRRGMERVAAVSFAVHARVSLPTPAPGVFGVATSLCLFPSSRLGVRWLPNPLDGVFGTPLCEVRGDCCRLPDGCCDRLVRGVTAATGPLLPVRGVTMGAGRGDMLDAAGAGRRRQQTGGGQRQRAVQRSAPCSAAKADGASGPLSSTLFPCLTWRRHGCDARYGCCGCVWRCLSVWLWLRLESVCSAALLSCLLLLSQ